MVTILKVLTQLVYPHLYIWQTLVFNIVSEPPILQHGAKKKKNNQPASKSAKRAKPF